MGTEIVGEKRDFAIATSRRANTVREIPLCKFMKLTSFQTVFSLVGSLLLIASPAGAGVTPPKGFAALFNGKDLKGWWGIGTEDPAKWMALSPEKLAEKKATRLEDITKHWSGEGDELVNDGRGLYLSTEKNYGDFELLLDYKTVAKADSGIYLRGIPRARSGITPRREGNGRLAPTRDQGGSGIIPRTGPAGILLFLPTNPSASGTASGYSWLEIS